MPQNIVWPLSTLCLHLCLTLASTDSCGELQILKKQRGVIQTPNFPGRFPLPIHCKWEIDASNFKNRTIVVYLTQYYVTSGVTFTEKTYPSEYDTIYESINSNRNLYPRKDYTWVQTSKPYLKISLDLDDLEGNHLRYLDDRKNVYYMFGFNITYEIISAKEKPKNSCNPQECSLLGDCYASIDLSSYECKCFNGYSGPKCSQGPLCEEEHCQNGGTCRQLSAVSFGCICPPGFVGSSCEYSAPVDCREEQCPATQCLVTNEPSAACGCSNPLPIPPDRVRIEAAVRLANTSATIGGYAAIWHKSYSFEEFFAKMLVKYLKNSGVTVIDDLGLKSMLGEVTFHFFGTISEGGRVKEALNKTVERGKLFNVSLDTTYLSFRREPSLKLVKLHVSKHPVRMDEEFSISCIAQGSIYMSFTWFKDGAYINESLSHRSLSLHLFNLSQGEYQYTLVVGKADLLDQGVYTCRVTDWGMEQCLSERISISSKPEVQLIPMSVTVEKGDKVDLRCIPSDKVPLQHELSYTWAKNKQLLKKTAGGEVWEDLHLNNYNDSINAGSVLEITNINDTVTYSCSVQGGGYKSEQSVRVEVVANRSASTLCPSEGAYGVAWPLTNSNMDALMQCPAGGMGVAVRHCLWTPNATASWQLPDFSDCSYRDFKAIATNLTRLTLGYEVTNTTEVLNSLLKAVLSRGMFRPGEGAKILDILNLVLRHLNRSSMDVYVAESVGPFYRIIDVLLGHESIFINDHQVRLLQRLVRRHGLLWAATFPIKTSKGTENVSNIFVEAASLSPAVSSLKFPPNLVPVPWFAGSMEFVVDANRIGRLINSSVTVVVTAYKRLTQFLPQRYLHKDSNGTDVLYELNSQIVAVDIGLGQVATHPPPEALTVSLLLEPLVRDFDARLWTWGCAVTDSASLRPTWNLNECDGQMLVGNVTRCTCHRPGTYALVLVSITPKVVNSTHTMNRTPVLVGCICCLVQCLVALSLLLPHWCRHRTCVVFLKIQCCLSVSGAMSIFIYSVHAYIPKVMYATVIALLEVFLLLPLTANLSILLVIYTEVVQVPRIRRIKQSVVCITTGAPLLAVLTNLLGHRSTGWPVSWWLEPGSMTFNVFVISLTITCGLFAFLYVNLLRKLRVLCLGNSEKNRSVVKRLGLLKRSGVVFLALILMESASILYINVQQIPYQYFFGSTSALLGSVILLCYAVKSESPPHLRLLKKLKMDPTTPDDFSSDSGISPLSFFTKQEGEQESEGGAPRRPSGVRVRGRDHHADPDAGEQLLMQDTTPTPRPGVGRSGLDESSTLETYVYSEASLNTAGTTPMSPNRYKPMSSFRVQEGVGFGEYVEQDLAGPAVKPLPVQSYILDPSASLPTEMITTRVCVELGVINTHQRNEVTGLEENAPALVLCSVDVEPCQSRVITHSMEGDPCQSRVTLAHDPCLNRATHGHGGEPPGVVVCSVDMDQTRLISNHFDGSRPGDPCRSEAPAIVICSVDVDQRQSRITPKSHLEGECSQKAADLPDSFCYGPSGNFVLGVTSSEPESLVCADPLPLPPLDLPELAPPCALPETNGHSPKSLSTISEEQKSEEGAEKSPKAKEAENMDMMDRISHDLDYLLNRKVQPMVPAVRKRAGNLKTAILEEREEEDMCSGPVEYLAKC